MSRRSGAAGGHFLTPLLLVLIHIFLGFANAGVTLASGNIAIKLSPAGEATTYLVANNMTANLFAGFANLIGGSLAALFAAHELYLNIGYLDHVRGSAMEIHLLNLRELDFLFIIAALLCLYAGHRLSLVKEEGEIRKDLFLQELVGEVMRGARHLTTAGGAVEESAFPLDTSPRSRE